MCITNKKIDWNKIFTFIKGKLFISIVIIGLIAFSSMQCSQIKELKRKKEISDQNWIATKDSLRFERKKNGELLVSIAGYISTEKELKDLNKSLWEKIKGQEGEIISLNHVVILLKQDTALLRKYLSEKDKKIEKLLKVDSVTYIAPWSLTYKYDKNNFDIFTGKTYIGISKKDPLELVHFDTELISRLTQIDLVWGQKVEKDVLRVFVQSNYPGFTVSQMSGVLIDPLDWPDLFKQPKRHWFQGVSIGVGITGGWNFITQKSSIVIGPTISYSIYTW